MAGAIRTFTLPRLPREYRRRARRSTGRRAPLLWLVLPLAAGAALAAAEPAAARVRAHPAAILAAALLAALFSLAASRRGHRAWAPLLVLAALLGGMANAALRRPPPLEFAGRPEREARLTLDILRSSPPPPGERTWSGLARIAAASFPARDLAGRTVAFSLVPRRGVPPPERSARIEAVGLLGPSAGGFRLSRGRVLRQARPPSAYRRFCARLGERMYARLGAGLESHPGLAAIYRAMMLGRRRDLSPGQRRDFLRTGTMHLFAINGLHIGVVALALHAVLALARCPRTPAAALVLAVLWLDVDSTGASPSALRAFAMVAVLELGALLRRPAQPLASLSLSALLALLAAPGDFLGASFQLSYGVTAVLCLYGLPLAERLQELGPPGRGPAAELRRHALGALGVGAAAALFGAPAGIEFFGLLSPGGLAANLVLAPPAFLVIAAGAGAVLLGPYPAPLLNRAAGVLLAFIAGCARLGARLPGMGWPAHFRAPWIGPWALALLLASCLLGYAGGWRRPAAGLWLPAAAVAIALLFGVRFSP
ncbi:MAG TPA: ComEC/Rec2 family competence protein [Opitutaceae bacterium]|nr:ComEC/Rec2 family competence protein [Opitutaceae bacterium]